MNKMHFVLWRWTWTSVGQVENIVVLNRVLHKSSGFGVLLPVVGFSKWLITEQPNLIIGCLDTFITEWHYLEKRHRREKESLVCTPRKIDLVICPFLSIFASYHEVVSFCYTIRVIILCLILRPKINMDQYKSLYFQSLSLSFFSTEKENQSSTDCQPFLARLLWSCSSFTL